MKTVKYSVWNLDVWGNEEEGFDVNDRGCYQRAVEFPTTHEIYNEGTDGEFAEDWANNKQIIDTLIEIGYLRCNCIPSDFVIDGDITSSLYVNDAENGCPICQLEYIVDL